MSKVNKHSCCFIIGGAASCGNDNVMIATAVDTCTHCKVKVMDSLRHNAACGLALANAQLGAEHAGLANCICLATYVGAATAMVPLIVQERVFVAASLKRAEQSLASYAEQLTMELTACAQDIAQLTAHVEEVGKVQGGDRRALSGLKGVVESRVQALGSTLQGALAAQAQHFGSVAQEYANFRAQKEQDVTAVKQQVDTLAQGVQALQQGISQHMSALAASTSTACEGMQSQAAQYAQAATAAAVAAQAAAGSAIDALVRGLEAQTAAMRSVAEQQATEAKQAEQLLKELADKAQAGFQSGSVVRSISCKTIGGTASCMLDHGISTIGIGLGVLCASLQSAWTPCLNRSAQTNMHACSCSMQVAGGAAHRCGCGSGHG